MSLDASLLLARMPPLHLIARARTHIYVEIGKLRKRNEANSQSGSCGSGRAATRGMAGSLK